MDPVDLLVFGPHPDDLEIGLGGTIAKHVAAGHRVGLCDLTAGEMGSNGTVEERLAEAEAARAVLGAAWRTNLAAGPTARSEATPSTSALPLRSCARCVRAPSPSPIGTDRHPDHVAASQVLTEAVFNAACGGTTPALKTPRGSPSGSATTSSTTRHRPSFVVDVSAHYEQKRRALRVPCEPVQGHRRATASQRG